MRTQSRSYTFPVSNFIVTANRFAFSLPSMFQDVAPVRTRRNSMQEYFENSYKIFMLRLGEFKERTTPLTIQEEKEFSFMLDALIAAKSLLTQRD